MDLSLYENKTEPINSFYNCLTKVHKTVLFGTTSLRKLTENCVLSDYDAQIVTLVPRQNHRLKEEQTLTVNNVRGLRGL